MEGGRGFKKPNRRGGWNRRLGWKMIQNVRNGGLGGWNKNVLGGKLISGEERLLGT